MKSKKIIYASISTLCFLVPLFVHAELKISEVMYDPEGSDTKREWIEVFNSGTESIDLSTYYLLENNVYHKITSDVSAVLAGGGYAVIASSIADLVQEFSQYTGLVVDSVFSLNNTGESIALANASKVTVDTFEYNSEMGANNTGQSLQINNGAVVVAGPTYGTVNKTESEVIIEPEEESTSVSSSGSSSSKDSTHSNQTNLSSYTPPSDFKVTAGRQRLVSINTPITFEAFISKSEIKAKYRWNFGDFETGNGRVVDHIYKYPGKYQVILETNSKDYTATTRTEVIVVEPQLSIENLVNRVIFTNKDSKELNIGHFKIVFNKETFVVPQDTIIKAGSSIIFSVPGAYIIERFEYPNNAVYQDFSPITDNSLMQIVPSLIQ